MTEQQYIQQAATTTAEFKMREVSALYAYASRIAEENFVIRGSKYGSPDKEGEREVFEFRVRGEIAKLPSRWGSVSAVCMEDQMWWEVFTLDQLNEQIVREDKIREVKRSMYQEVGCN